MPTIPSNTIHARRFPAISRSFISKSSSFFVSVTSLARNLFGHSKRQLVGFSASFPGIQPPPTPYPDASTQPRNLGSPITNSFAVVGSCADSFSSVLQYRNAWFADGKSFHRTICGFPWRILLIGVINFFPLGLLLLHVGFFNQFFLLVWIEHLLSCAQSCAGPHQSQFACPEPVRCTVLRH